MKKKFLKLFTSVAMLALVFCLHQNVRAEDIAQPTEKDVYIHHDDGEDYVANRYERSSSMAAGLRLDQTQPQRWAMRDDRRLRAASTSLTSM